MFLLRQLRRAPASLRRSKGKAEVIRPTEVSDTDDDSADEVGELPQIDDSKYFAKKQRHSVSAEVYGEHNKPTVFEPPVYPKSDEQKIRIRVATSHGFMFSALTPTDLDTVIGAFQERDVKPGETVIQQGDEGDFLFLIEEGQFDVYKTLPGDTEPRHMCVMTSGDTVGELALLYSVPRAATVKAKTDAVIWLLDRKSFNHVVKDSAFRRRARHEMFLGEVSVLKDMDAYERSQIADALKTASYTAGAEVITEGDIGNKFYIIESGEAVAYKMSKPVMTYARGDYFGELALIRDQPRAATVKAKTDLDVVWLDRRSFQRLCGPLDTILKRNAENYKKLQSILVHISDAPDSNAPLKPMTALDETAADDS